MLAGGDVRLAAAAGQGDRHAVCEAEWERGGWARGGGGDVGGGAYGRHGLRDGALLHSLMHDVSRLWQRLGLQWIWEVLLHRHDDPRMWVNSYSLVILTTASYYCMILLLRTTLILLLLWYNITPVSFALMLSSTYYCTLSFYFTELFYHNTTRVLLRSPRSYYYPLHSICYYYDNITPVVLKNMSQHYYSINYKGNADLF